MRALLLFVAVVSAGCKPTIGSPCMTDSDCFCGTTNLRCVGNFTCKSGACSFDCAPSCSADGGCPTGQVCQEGVFCSNNSFQGCK